jgi:uncharacterized membrane protein YoaK (UPF0700 family)
MFSASPTTLHFSPPPASRQLHIPDVLWISLLAMVGGFINGAGYFKLYGILTTGMTGNFFSLPLTLSSQGYTILCRGMVLLSFFLTAFLATMLADFVRWASLQRLKKTENANASIDADRVAGLVLFSFEIVLLVLVWIFGMTWNTEIVQASSENTWQCVLVASIMSAAASLQSVALAETKTYQRWPSTVVVTMTTILFGIRTQKFVVSHIALVRGTSKRHNANFPSEEPAEASLEASGKLFLAAAKARAEVLEVFLTLSGFFCGVIMGIETMETISWHCMFVPIVIVIVILLDTFFRGRGTF